MRCSKISGRHHHRVLFFVIAWFFLLLCGFFLHAFAKSGYDPGGYRGAGIDPGALPSGGQGVFDAAKRIQQLADLPDQARIRWLSPGDMLSFDLFGSRISAVIERVSTNRLGTLNIRGTLPAYPMGHFSLSVTKGKSLGYIRIPGEKREYAIFPDPGRAAHYLAELDPAWKDLRGSASPLRPDSRPADRRETGMLHAPVAQAGIDEGDEVVIRVMVVYTPAARRWANRQGGGIENEISLAVEEAQLVMDNSDVPVLLELVHAGEVGYTESGRADTDLERLQNPDDGYMDAVHEWRDEYGADLVSLFARLEDVGGISYQLEDPEGSPDFGFSLVRVQQALTSYTLAHELGHNLGMGHHKEQTRESGPAMFSYSAGWRWQKEENGFYSTVMTYVEGRFFENGASEEVVPDSTMVPHYSNPDVFFEGEPTGDYADADNARTARQTVAVVAAYRPEPSEDDTENGGTLSGSGSGGCFIGSMGNVP